MSKELELMSDITKELAVKTYEDVAQPTLKSAGGVFELLTRAIRATLSNLEIWTLKREFQIKETAKLLEIKLKNVPIGQIETPEPYIAVPALQYISYCMDNHELRDMYANLLASSMNKVVKNGVHPGYVEIIKQLCPDEAKILRYFAQKETIPIISIYYGNDLEGSIRVVKDFSDVGFLVGCENPLDICKYLDNMLRLRLIEVANSSTLLSSSLADKNLYEPLKQHSYIQSVISKISIPGDKKNEPKIIESYASITDYGRGFCSICLNIPMVSDNSISETVIEESKFLTDSDVATDEEVNEMLEDVFGKS